MNPISISSESPEDTQRVGRQLGQVAQPGDVILLVGELGTGKTCLTQGIAWGLGFEEYARSPSFVLVTEYWGRLPLYHIDLYRIERLDEVLDLGLDDYLYDDGVCVVEWADRAMRAFPSEHLLVRIEHVSENQRLISLEPRGRRYEEMLEELSEGFPSKLKKD